jgi:hypothetical protein
MTMVRKERFIVAGLVLLGASACAPMATQAPPPMPMPVQQCNAEGARWAVGRAATADVVERIRVDTGSQVARVLHPGEVVTMEYRGDRVNLKVNERDAIVGITCG